MKYYLAITNGVKKAVNRHVNHFRHYRLSNVTTFNGTVKSSDESKYLIHCTINEARAVPALTRRYYREGDRHSRGKSSYAI